MKTVLTLASLMLAASPAWAQRGDPPFGGQKDDAFNLGVLGAEGIPESNQIKVTQVLDSGPAKAAGLLKDDLITHVNGSVFPSNKDPIFVLFDFLEKATQVKKAKMVVTVLRDGRSIRLKIAIPYQGRHSATCPRKCKRCEAILKQSLAWLAGQQKADGHWDSGMRNQNSLVAVTSLAATALMMSGGYNAHVKKAADYVVARVGTEESFGGLGGEANWNQTNWSLGYGGVFLAQVYQRSKSAALKKKLTEISKKISENQEKSGGWAHGPGGPNALGYLELEIMSNWMLAALGMMRQAGIEVANDTLEKGIKYVEQCSTRDGGIGYSHTNKGMGDAGRTSGAIWAYMCLKVDKGAFFKKMVGYYTSRMNAITNGHVSPVMHYMTGGLAAHKLGAGTWKKFMGIFRNEFMGARRPDGAFAARPTEESKMMRSNSDRELGLNWTTANYLIILQLPTKRLKY